MGLQAGARVVAHAMAGGGRRWPWQDHRSRPHPHAAAVVGARAPAAYPGARQPGRTVAGAAAGDVRHPHLDLCSRRRYRDIRLLEYPGSGDRFSAYAASRQGRSLEAPVQRQPLGSRAYRRSASHECGRTGPPHAVLSTRGGFARTGQGTVPGAVHRYAASGQGHGIPVAAEAASTRRLQSRTASRRAGREAPHRHDSQQQAVRHGHVGRAAVHSGASKARNLRLLAARGAILRAAHAVHRDRESLRVRSWFPGPTHGDPGPDHDAEARVELRGGSAAGSCSTARPAPAGEGHVGGIA